MEKEQRIYTLRDIPWPVILLCITLIGNGAVSYYRISQLEQKTEEHVKYMGHPALAGRVIALETRDDNSAKAEKSIERQLDQLGDRLKNITSRIRELERAR